MNINHKYPCPNLLLRIYSIGFDGSKTRLLSDRNCLYFDQILIPSKTIVRVVENCLSKWPIAEPSTYRKVALWGADIKFRCPLEAQIDASKYSSKWKADWDISFYIQPPKVATLSTVNYFERWIWTWKHISYWMPIWREVIKSKNYWKNLIRKAKIFEKCNKIGPEKTLF